ncbi:MAG: transglycosylase domain-containing protein [Patescibacteria group bacterium]
MPRSAPPSRHAWRRHRRHGAFFFTSATFLAGIGVAVTAAALYVAVLIRELPSPDEFSARDVNQSTKLYDRTGEILLYEIHGEEKRTVIPFDEIPLVLKQATLAAEDAGFYSQPAFDWKSIVRALIANIREGRVTQGGSTITQQLVKNIFLSPERTITRKIKELILAVELESKYTKDEIFNFYLNQIPYGSNAYGVEAASETYFGKSVRDLSLAESATLAALTKAPSFYSPWGTHRDELIARKDRILERMVELGYLTAEALESAQTEEITFQPPSLGAIKAPHFVLAVKEYLVNRYGESIVLNGGLRVVTTLNMKLQELAERAVLEGSARNAELYKSHNGALVAQDP